MFSAGLDIMEMYKPDMKRVETFWTTLQEVWIKLFGSNFITAAAINVGWAMVINTLQLLLALHPLCFFKKDLKNNSNFYWCYLLNTEYKDVIIQLFILVVVSFTID